MPNEPASSDATASTVDLLPTLCAVADVPVPDDLPLDGASLLAEHADRAEAMAAEVRAWLAEPRHSWRDAP
ncbi:MAG TPA: hypothetical protein PK468_13010 [Candidatus Hydrogenedentes bacterium]|nr:hypothetical protein [Candidatus Hydrogenedentota bacterium]